MFGTLVVILVMVSVLIGLNALYVAGEFAAVSARKSRIEQAAKQGNRIAQTLLPVLEDTHKLDNLIAVSQVGITLSSVALGIYGQQQIAPYLVPVLVQLPFIDSDLAAGGIAAILVLLVLTVLQVVLGELVPKSLALQYPEQVALSTTMPMRWSGLILKPLIIILNGSGTLLLRLLGANHHEGHKHIHSPEEIQILIGQSTEGGLLDAEDRRLLDNAFRVGEMSASEVMVPRTRMIAVSIDTPLRDLLRLAADSGYTRVPVYEDNIDHIIGFVHLKEMFHLFYTKQETSIRSILRKIPYVPETMSANEVWETLDKERSYLAIVFDEYGGTAGMITREDLIEELFGEVQDEFDDEQEPITKQDEKQYLVRGDVLITRLNEVLNIELPNTYANTIGGLVLHELGRIPQVNDEVVVNEVSFRVQSATDRAAEEIVVTLPPDALLPAEEDTV